MTNTTITDTLLEHLKADSTEYQTLDTTDYTLTEKKNAIRSLMNIRMPKETSQSLLRVQDDYLQEELAAKGIVSLSAIPTIEEQYGFSSPYGGKLSIWQGDITRLQVGAIVNAANSQMLGCFIPCHRCIDNAIHSAAGIQLRSECQHIMQEKKMRYGSRYEEPTGSATLTAAYNLPCDHVIHTVGPIVYGRLTDALKQDLRSCYASVLDCCMTHQIRSVAFCCISTGEFHFPNDEAAKIAIETVADFLAAHEEAVDRIIFNVFKDTDREIYEHTMKRLSFK